MNIIILQHIAIEHPGILLDFFREDGFRWTTVELDEGDAIPELELIRPDGRDGRPAGRLAGG